MKFYFQLDKILLEFLKQFNSKFGYLKLKVV